MPEIQFDVNVANDTYFRLSGWKYTPDDLT